MKKLLIIEDNEDMLFLYRRLFRKEQDVTLSDAINAELGFSIAMDSKPDLMIIDISLPGMNGIELTRKIKERLPDTRILIVTGHEVTRYREAAMQAGADDILSKESDEALLARCRTLLWKS